MAVVTINNEGSSATSVVVGVPVSTTRGTCGVTNISSSTVTFVLTSSSTDLTFAGYAGEEIKLRPNEVFYFTVANASADAVHTIDVLNGSVQTAHGTSAQTGEFLIGFAVVDSNGVVGSTLSDAAIAELNSKVG